MRHPQFSVTLGKRRGMKIGRAHMRPVLRTPIIGPRSDGGSLGTAQRRFSDEGRRFLLQGGGLEIHRSNVL